MPTIFSNRRFSFESGVVLPDTKEDSPILVFTSPNEEIQLQLTDSWLIDSHTLQSSLDQDETARLEFEPSHIAVILKRPENYSSTAPGEFRVASLGAFLYEDKLVIIQSDGMQLFEGGRSFNQCESLQGALLQLMFHTIAQFMANIKLINHVSNSIESNIENSLNNSALSSMFELQKGLVYYQSAIHSNHMLLNKLKLNAGRIGFTPEELEFLDDILVENGQCEKLTEIYASILSSLSDARVSVISNNLSVLMKKLTVISIIFMPINILASMGGMSEWTVFTSRIPWPISYALFSLLMVIVGIITWLIVRNVGIQPRPKRQRNMHGLLGRALHSFTTLFHFLK